MKINFLEEEVILDFLNPLLAFKALEPLGASFLFESVEKSAHFGRYSIIGLNKLISIEIKNSYGKIVRFSDYEFFKCLDPIEFLKNEIKSLSLKKDNKFAAFYGYFSYENIYYFEPKTKVNKFKKDTLKLPDIILSFPEAIVIFDNLKQKVKIFVFYKENEEKRAIYFLKQIKDALLSSKITLSPLKDINFSKKELLAEFKVNISDKDYKLIVKKAKEYIRQGDIIQVVLSRKFYKDFFASPFDLYRALRFTNPSPYMYYLNYNNFYIVGASPEVLVKKIGKEVIIRPIAGTRRRGKTLEEDKALEIELLNDEKEKAEHIMLVDLARNDLGKIAKPGSVKVNELMTIEKYSHVMHIVSNVIAEPKENIMHFDIFKAAFPAGTVTGAPKVRAMQIIDELEPDYRSVYAGAVGYFNLQNDFDTAIAIRTGIIKNNKFYVQTGAVIVADSIEELEVKETQNKAMALLKAVKVIENI